MTCVQSVNSPDFIGTRKVITLSLLILLCGVGPSEILVLNADNMKFLHRMEKGKCADNNNIIYLFTAIGLLPGGSGYFTCNQNMKLVTIKFKWGGLHEKHVVATWNVGNRLSVCL